MGQTENTAVMTNPITEGVIWKQLLKFFFPILFGTFFQQLYNTADAMIVGQFVGKEALAAVGGSTSTLINLIVGFFVGIASGATVIISQYYGAKSAEKVHWAVHTSVLFSIIGGAVLMVIGLLVSGWALGLMNTPADVMEYATLYMRIYFVGIIGNLLYNVGSGILRAVGDSKRPLYYLIVCCFANIALDLLFIVVFHMGVMGAALATILSQLISGILVLRAMMRTDDIYRLELTKLRIDGRMLKRIVRIGFPAGLQSIMYSVSNVIVQAGVNLLGTNVVAAWAAYGKVDGVFWMTINALGIAVTTFVGQNYGAGKKERVYKGIRVCMLISVVICVAMAAFLLLLGKLLLGLFTTDAAVLNLGVQILDFLAPMFITYVTIEILSGALRGVGDCWIPMLITCIGVCVLRVLWVAFVLPVYPTIICAGACYPVSWVVSSVAFVIYYFFFSRLKRERRKKR